MRLRAAGLSYEAVGWILAEVRCAFNQAGEHDAGDHFSGDHFADDPFDNHPFDDGPGGLFAT
jgi:hypothetical protein